jgi:uncharacterized protein (TIGR01777 family)
MKIVVAGGSGFLGSGLARAWRGDGHEVKVLTRHPRTADDVPWTPESGGGAWAAELERSDAVVNLAGEGIADKRWTAARKAAILESRIQATRALVHAIRNGTNPPPVFISGSAVGFYGTDAGEPRTEESPSGSDFLAKVCQSWEREASAAAEVTRVVLLRTGVVLGRDGGALPRMALPFRFFVGGRIGSGQQPLSWIHRDDWIEMVRWALRNADVSGPLNLTAPSPVTNAEFTRALAQATHRPALFPAPAFALRLMLGKEMADSLLLDGQRVLPAKAQRLGFQFRFQDVHAALRNILGAHNGVPPGHA